MTQEKEMRVYKRSAESRERDKLRKRAKRALQGFRDKERAKDRDSQMKVRAAKRVTVKLPKVRTGTPEYRRAIQAKYPMPAGMTKGDIRRMFAIAAANTATLQESNS